MLCQVHFSHHPFLKQVLFFFIRNSNFFKTPARSRLLIDQEVFFDNNFTGILSSSFVPLVAFSQFCVIISDCRMVHTLHFQVMIVKLNYFLLLVGLFFLSTLDFVSF